MCCKYYVCESQHKEVHSFTDASKDAIASVAFLKVWKDEENSDIGFLMGKAKVAPTHGHTIQRLELCAAVLGIDSRNHQRTDGFREEEFQVLQ